MQGGIHKYKHAHQGFTIVELLIVIVVIGILAAIVIVAYNGVQNRANDTRLQNDIRQIAKLVENYNTLNGTYPSTGSLSSVYSDSNCTFAADSDGYKGVDWIPGITTDMSIPQNPGLVGTGRSKYGGCYMYASDGTNYVLSAWNGKRTGPTTDTMYRRLGFRETSFSSANSYLCNNNNIGGAVSTYSATTDFYKYSYTISSITSCNETPPAGA